MTDTPCMAEAELERARGAGGPDISSTSSLPKWRWIGGDAGLTAYKWRAGHDLAVQLLLDSYS